MIAPVDVEVLITQPLSEKHIELLTEVSPLLRITVFPALTPEEIPIEIWERTEVLYTQYTLPDPEKAPNLRWIQFHMTGIDKVVNTPIMQNPDIHKTNMSGASESQVAEYILTMLLSLGHYVPDMMALQSRNQWPTNRWERFSPVELRKSTVGIVGYGSIGRQVAYLLQPFGTTVLAAKRNVMRTEQTGYTLEGQGDPQGDLFVRLYPYQALRAMLKECDFVVITVPLTPETRGLISYEQLDAFKPTSFIIDASRGGIIDHQALLKALQDQKIAGAALDVFPEEPLPADSPLWDMPNVIITPHIAGASSFYEKRVMSLFIENLRRYLTDEPLHNLVNVDKGY
jgi:phosphoglycerate dehydrogenase-like enzyme